MNKALVISKTESGLKSIAQLLHAEMLEEIDYTISVDDAKDKLCSSLYDLIVINTPLDEENGLNFSIYCANNTKACIILIVQQDKAIEVYNLVGPYGVLVIQRPINKHMFHHYIIFTSCFKKRLLSVEKDNQDLKYKLEEIKVIDRAKLLLMQHLKMTEKQAHHYLEKKAMNTQANKLVIAKQVINSYED